VCIKIIFIAKLYQIYALLNEHKNIWLNLHRSVPLSTGTLVFNTVTEKAFVLSTPVQSGEPLQKMLDHQKMPQALSPCHERVETFQIQSEIYELPASENID